MNKSIVLEAINLLWESKKVKSKEEKASDKEDDEQYERKEIADRKKGYIHRKHTHK